MRTAVGAPTTFTFLQPARQPTLRPARRLRPVQFKQGAADPTDVKQKLDVEGIKAQIKDLDTDKAVKLVSDKWNEVPDKTTFVTYTVGGLVGLWACSFVLGIIGNIPLMPRTFEMIGVVSLGWFSWRYLLFKSSRDEVMETVKGYREKLVKGAEE